MRRWIGSALVQIMAYSAPSHYLNQYWIVVSWTITNKLKWNFNQNTKHFIHKNAPENIVCKMGPFCPRKDELRQRATSCLYVSNGDNSILMPFASVSLVQMFYETDRKTLYLYKEIYEAHSIINKANLRDLITTTGLVILLKLDSNHWFFSPSDLEI